MILYPTETIYALGVNAFDEAEIAKLFLLKGRSEGKSVSLLVRNAKDIARWGVMSTKAVRIAERFLPGPLTLVLPAKSGVPECAKYHDGTVSFRISTDLVAQKLIEEFMAEYDAPLTCTSANLSGLPSLPTPGEIFIQLGDKASLIDRVIPDGERTGVASTVVRVIGEELTIHRQGLISESAILAT